MKSPNFTVILIVGFYLEMFSLREPGGYLLGGEITFLLACAAALPIVLIIRRRFYRAASLTAIAVLFTTTMLIIHQSTLTTSGFIHTVKNLPFPFLILVFVLLPGLFMVSELDPERLPHEISYWSGLKIFLPLVSVFAARERFLRRLAVIQQNWELRGIELKSPLQHICRFSAWIVPLATATICETGYAYKLRRMLNSAHWFIPGRPKKPVLSIAQKIFFVIFLLVFLLELQNSSIHG